MLSDINIPLSILDNMFYEAVDNDGKPIRVEIGLLFKDLDLDGVEGINQKDYDLAEKIGGDAFRDFETNLDAMIDVITNVENPSFDRPTTAGMLADYLTSMDQEKYNASFDAAVRSKEKTTGKDGLVLSYGHRTFGQMKRSYDLIQSTPVGEYYEGESGHRFLRQQDGNYLGPDEKTYTPNQVKRQQQFNHLPDFEVANKEAAPVYTPSTYKTGNYLVGKKRYSTIGEAVGAWERDFKKKNKDATKQEIADAVAAERILMERAQ